VNSFNTAVREFHIWNRPPDGTSVHRAMLSLMEWMVTNIPFSYDLAIDHHAAVAASPLDAVLHDLARFEGACLCGGLSLLMARLARQEGYDAIELNVGSQHGGPSHVLVLAAVSSNKRIIYDPTFGCYSGTTDGTPISIYAVIDCLRDGRASQLRWVKSGVRERSYLFGPNPDRAAPLKSVVAKLDDRRTVGSIDVDHFGEIFWDEALRWTHAQRPQSDCVFDFLRFPIGTSGEAEAEQIMADLRALP
jgi:hypothetical protein